MFRQYEITRNTLQNKSRILQIYCDCNKYFRRYTVKIRYKVILNSLVKGFLVKDWLACLQFPEGKVIFFWSSLADRLVGIPIFQSDEQGSFSFVRRQRGQGFNLVFILIYFRRQYSIHIHLYSFVPRLV